MKVSSLELNNFRNYKQEQINFNNGVNILFGQNGEGKTNIIESIYMLSLGRSFRTNKDKEMINLGEQKSIVRAKIESLGREYTIEYKIDYNSKKSIKINSLPITKLTELLGILNVVIFSPEDLRLVKDGPKERRLFVDRELSQLKPRYYMFLNDYYKNLQNRNNLLKQNNIDKILLDVYDTQLSKNAVEIIKYRQDFIEKISKIAKKNHLKISSNKENLDIFYEKSIDATDIEAYKKILKQNFENDKNRKTTNIGIHRDDLDIKINNIDLRSFGSQGQKRSSAISLKLSEIELIYELRGEYPVVLLDDIFSELDKERQYMLIDSIKNTQTFITTAEDIDLDLETNKYNIKNASVTKS